MPSLVSLELSSNQIGRVRSELAQQQSERGIFPHLEEIRLEWNELTSWDDLSDLSRLKSLVVSSFLAVVPLLKQKLSGFGYFPCHPTDSLRWSPLRFPFLHHSLF